MKELDNIYVVYLDDKSTAGIDHIKKKDNLDTTNQVIRTLLGVYACTTHDSALCKILEEEEEEE